MEIDNNNNNSDNNKYIYTVLILTNFTGNNNYMECRIKYKNL